MPRKQKTIASEYRNISINQVKVYAYPPNERKPGDVGFVRVFYSPNERFSANYHLADFPLISVWLDPNRVDAVRTCKVHMSAPVNPKTENGKNAVRVVNFLRSMPAQRSVNLYGTPEMSLSIDDHVDILRFGSKDIPFRSTPSGDRYGSSVPVFDSKAQAFNSIMEAIKNYAAGTVAGVDLINLDNVSDAVLEEMGFTKVVDQIGLGTPMWSGDARAITTLGRRTYGSSSYGSSRGDSTSKEVVESFLDLIEQDLSAV